MFDVLHAHFSTLGFLFLQYADVLGSAVGRPPRMTRDGWSWLCEERGLLTASFPAAAARAVYERVTARKEGGKPRREGGKQRRDSPARPRHGRPSPQRSPLLITPERSPLGGGGGGAAAAPQRSPKRASQDGSGGLELADFLSALAHAAYRRANPLWREPGTAAATTTATSAQPAAGPSSPSPSPSSSPSARRPPAPVPLPECLHRMLAETLSLTAEESKRQASLTLP